MKTIDIKTTQNVTITYELAEARERILAFIIDIVFKSIGLLVIWWIYILFVSNAGSGNEEYFAYIVLIPIATFYTLFFELFMNGQTPGKKIMKLKVIKLDGKQPGFYDYLIRWTFRILDVFLSTGVVGVILISSTDKAQRLGDMTSNSTVVRVNNKVSISLKDILNIDSRHNYEPKYPMISNFPEDDILLIKQTIERYNKFKNEAHKKAVIRLCEILSEKLGVENVGADKLGFLKTLIKDYIVLTR